MLFRKYWAAGLILLLTSATLVYGHKVRKQMDAATREYERLGVIARNCIQRALHVAAGMAVSTL